MPARRTFPAVAPPETSSLCRCTPRGNLCAVVRCTEPRAGTSEAVKSERKYKEIYMAEVVENLRFASTRIARQFGPLAGKETSAKEFIYSAEVSSLDYASIKSNNEGLT